MKKLWFLVVLGLLAGLALLAGAAGAMSPAGEGIDAPAAHPATLICPDLVDLSWDPSQHEEETFDGEVCTADWGYYFVRRGPDPYDVNKQSVIGQLEGKVGFYRDQTVAEGQVYWYDTIQRYNCPSGKTHLAARKLGSTPVTIGERCQGDLFHDLDLGGSELENPGIRVRKGATLNISGATIEGGALLSEGDAVTTDAPGGVIQIEHSTLNNTEVTFSGAGDNYFTNNKLYGQATHIELSAHEEAEVLIAHNDLFTGWLTISGDPLVTIYDNDFYQGSITIKGWGDPVPDRILIDRNRFYDASQVVAIWQYGGEAVYIGNTFQGTGPTRDRQALVIEHSLTSDSFLGVASILGNKISGYQVGVGLGGGSQVTFEANLFLDNETGIRFRYNAQATLTNNTLKDNREGLYVWDEANVTMGQSCIAGNELGVSTSASAEPGMKVDARENWWGHASGPQHPANPGGTGDRVSSRAVISDWLPMDNCIVDIAAGIVDADGGTVTSSSGQTSITLPAGAVSSDTQVTLKPRDPSVLGDLPQPPENQATVRLFDVSATRTSDGTPLTRLDEAATLTVNYSKEERTRVDEKTMGLHRLDQRTSTAAGPPAPGDLSLDAATWLPLDTTLDAKQRTLTAQSRDLGTFAVFGESLLTDIYLPLVLRVY